MASAHQEKHPRKTGPLKGRRPWRGYANRPPGTGSPQTKTGFATMTAAMAWAATREQELRDEHAAASRAEAAALAAPQPADSPTLDQWWPEARRLLVDKPVSARYLAEFDATARMFWLHRWGRVPVEDLRGKPVSEWLRRLVTLPGPDDRLPDSRSTDSARILPIGPERARTVLAHLKRVGTLAFQEGITDVNYLAAATAPPLPRRRPRFMLVADFERVWPHLPPWAVVPVRSFVYTGMRIGELAAVDRDSTRFAGLLDIDKVLVEPAGKGGCDSLAWRPVPKGDRYRTVPLIRHVDQWWAEHERAFPPAEHRLDELDDQGRPTGRTVLKRLRFADGQGRPLCRHRLRTAWNAAKAASGAEGVDQVRVHDLRHTAASLAKAAGLSQSELGVFLGHGPSSAATRVYEHLQHDWNTGLRTGLERYADMGAEVVSPGPAYDEEALGSGPDDSPDDPLDG